MYIQGRRQLREIGGAKLKSGGQTFSPKCEGFFWPKSQIFRPKAGDLQKKKVFAEIRRLFRAEIANFPTKSRWSPKKKKKVFAKIEAAISCNFANSEFEGGLFSNGGAIFHFSQKIGLKSTKSMRFCILHKPMGGGSSPPRPPLATLLRRVTELSF